MYQLVYVSTARADLGEDDLHDILSRSRQTNAALGITGMLVHAEGCFVQVLEGHRDVVCDLFARIEADPRHCRARVLFEGDVAGRAFPGWSMGFREARAEDLYMAGFLALTRRAMEGRASRADARVLRTIVETLYRPGDAPTAAAGHEPVTNAA